MPIGSSINTLANGVELVRCVAMEIVGNEVADTINGTPLTMNTIYELAQSSFMKSLESFRSK